MTSSRAPARSAGGGSSRSEHQRPTAGKSTVPVPPVGGPLAAVFVRASASAERWTPTVGRILLGLVLAWFGYHELAAPGSWTGYVPIVSATSHLAEVLVLVHGWVLLMLAVALVAGIAPRLAAAIAALLLLEIVVSLIVSAGLSDLVLRDVGVLGLAVTLTGARTQRLLLQR